eukprot:scaffold75973_cov27-Prasinocladus_malaysianus.AAC.1
MLVPKASLLTTDVLDHLQFPKFAARRLPKPSLASFMAAHSMCKPSSGLRTELCLYHISGMLGLHPSLTVPLDRPAHQSGGTNLKQRGDGVQLPGAGRGMQSADP